MYGKVYIIPATVGDSSIDVIPQKTIETMRKIRYFIVEDVRMARRYLSKIKMPVKIDELFFSELNEHTKPNEIPELLGPVFQGNDIGIISDAGVPCVADPGAALIDYAHKKNIQIVPLIGPSSILLALMAAGMNGQNFAFAGYLPVKELQRCQRIQFLEKRSKHENQTQIFIETPYRNLQLFKSFISICNPSTQLCIAANITLADEFIKTMTVEGWKKSELPDINKKPCIFILQG
ncbi:MAG: SAM-dependent methyltransferase [Prevotellaceae bacterium]|jgi:16S rRNA (cytidine1402-2'-O)-methyltransferase|nr:SAM-dependent methyltransferase [Prevotellaceae bacterium]